MFSKWLNTDNLASWDKLIMALTTIELTVVASDIQQGLLKGTYVPAIIGHSKSILCFLSTAQGGMIPSHSVYDLKSFCGLKPDL